MSIKDGPEDKDDDGCVHDDYSENSNADSSDTDAGGDGDGSTPE